MCPLKSPDFVSSATPLRDSQFYLTISRVTKTISVDVFDRAEDDKKCKSKADAPPSASPWKVFSGLLRE